MKIGEIVETLICPERQAQPDAAPDISVFDEETDPQTGTAFVLLPAVPSLITASAASNKKK